LAFQQQEGSRSLTSGSEAQATGHLQYQFRPAPDQDPFAKAMPAVPHGIVLFAVDGGRDGNAAPYYGAAKSLVEVPVAETVSRVRARKTRMYFMVGSL